MKYKVTRTGKERFIVSRSFFGIVWKTVNTLPSFSLAKNFVIQQGSRSFMYEEFWKP